MRSEKKTVLTQNIAMMCVPHCKENRYICMYAESLITHSMLAMSYNYHNHAFWIGWAGQTQISNDTVLKDKGYTR